MSWLDVEDAMQAAVVTASDLPAEQVSWSYLPRNEPELDHVVIDFDGGRIVGQDWRKISYDASRPAGQEIKLEIKGVRECVFEISVFTADTDGERAARHRADRIRTMMQSDNIRHSLRQVGVSLYDVGEKVRWIPDVYSVGFRGRAIATLRCYVPVMDCFEYVTFIERIKGRIIASGAVTTSYGISGIAFDSANG